MTAASVAATLGGGTSSVVRRGNVALHVRTWGAGFPLLLLHGLGASSELWIHQLSALGKLRRLVALDLRGFGRSDRPATPGAYAIAELAEDVTAVAEALGFLRADVLGTSMGGFVAQQLALAERALCRSLVLCHTAARMSMPPELVASRLALLRSAPMEAYGRLVAEQALAPGADPALRSWLARMIGSNDPRTYEQVLTEGLSGFDLSERVDRIRVPVLVVVGEHDRVIPAVEGRALAARIPGAELCELAGAGHIGYAERPEAFNGAVSRFLERVDRSVPR